MLKLTGTQRTRVAEKIMDFDNLVFIGLVIAQAVPGPISKTHYILVGLGSITAAYLFALRIMKGVQDSGLYYLNGARGSGSNGTCYFRDYSRRKEIRQWATRCPSLIFT